MLALNRDVLHHTFHRSGSIVSSSKMIQPASRNVLRTSSGTVSGQRSTMEGGEVEAPVALFRLSMLVNCEMSRGEVWWEDVPGRCFGVPAFSSIMPLGMVAIVANTESLPV
jgi:hypothetical protein